MLIRAVRSRRGVAGVGAVLALAIAGAIAVPVAIGAAGQDEIAAPALLDPFDARHVDLHLAVTANTATADNVSVGVGAASNHPAGGRAVVLHLLDSRAGTLSETGLPEPLERHVYPWPNQPVHPDRPIAVHETEYLDSTTTTVALPLLQASPVL